MAKSKKAKPSPKSEKAIAKEDAKREKKTTKNDLVVQFYTENPDGTRAEAAEFAGCSSSQVLWLFQRGRLPEGTGAARTGGLSKGDQIVAYYAEHPDAKRQEVADAVGCTVQRVGETVRAGLTGGAGVPASKKTKVKAEKQKAEKKSKKAKAPTTKGVSELLHPSNAKPVKKAPAKKATATATGDGNENGSAEVQSFGERMKAAKAAKKAAAEQAIAEGNLEGEE